MANSSSSSIPLFPSSQDRPVLSEAWLVSCLDEADWRYRLLEGVIQFALTHFASFEPLGVNHLVQFTKPAEETQLRIFLDALGRLTLSPPRFVKQEPSNDLYVLLHQP